MAPTKRDVPATILLFFVAPLVAEYLLGDLPITFLPALILLAPMYGGGAVLIRETARRAGRGWPTILVLGAAYAVLEEGLATQSLFNPDYLHLHMQFLAPAPIAWLGVGGWWTLLMLNVHTFWSIGVSIALVEALVPSARQEPWLRLPGEVIFGLIFAVGVVANAVFGVRQNHFMAKPTQLIGAGVVSLALTIVAFVLPRGPAGGEPSTVPPPWGTGLVAAVLGAVVMTTPRGWGWGACGVLLGADLLFLVLVARFSRSSRWTPLHVLSLAAGGALVYGVRSFVQRPLVGAGPLVHVGNVVFCGAALGLVALGVRRTLAAEAATGAASL